MAVRSALADVLHVGVQTFEHFLQVSIRCIIKRRNHPSQVILTHHVRVGFMKQLGHSLIRVTDSPKSLAVYAFDYLGYVHSPSIEQGVNLLSARYVA